VTEQPLDRVDEAKIRDQLVDPPLVSVVLPAYNEAATIVDVVEDVLAEVEQGSRPADAVEVLIVDDDSPDETWRVAREAFTDDDRIRVLRRVDGQGLSSAVLDGFREARGRICVCMDADGQHPADRLTDLVDEVVLGADLVVGSRHVDGGSIERWTTSRKVTSKVATLLARAFIPSAREITDPMSGFFAVNRESFDDDVLDAADPHGYKILLEFAALVPGARVAEVPITFRAREAGESKLTLDEQVRFLEHCFSLWCLSTGLDERVSPPLAVRSVEAASVIALALGMMNAGLVLGDVDGALGAGLIAAAGGTIVLGAQRLARTGESWSDTNEVFAK
jgi:dolichol-phosphate mannosyltransferase